jgi:hypothetical protein
MFAAAFSAGRAVRSAPLRGFRFCLRDDFVESSGRPFDASLADRNGSFASILACPLHVWLPSVSDRRADILNRQLRAICGRLRVGNENRHVAGLVGAAMCSAFACGSRAPSFAFAQARREISPLPRRASRRCPASPHRALSLYFGAAAGETGCRSSPGFSSSKICLMIFFFVVAKTSSPASSPMLKP